MDPSVWQIVCNPHAYGIAQARVYERERERELELENLILQGLYFRFSQKPV